MRREVDAVRRRGRCVGAAEVAGEGAGEQAHLELVHGTGRRRFGLTHDHTAGWALVSEGRCDSLSAAADAKGAAGRWW